MSHRHKAELSADALALLLEEPTSELGPIVRNDTAWDTKSADNRFEEGNNSTLGDADHRGSLRPLCEFVDGDEEEPIPADGPGEWSQDIHPHMANGQEGGIVCRAWAGVCICFAWNWHALQDFTNSAASWRAVSQ
jgi:hypothetical protein